MLLKTLLNDTNSLKHTFETTIHRTHHKLNSIPNMCVACFRHMHLVIHHPILACVTMSLPDGRIHEVRYCYVKSPASSYIKLRLLMSSFFPTTLGEIIKTYDAGRSFVTLPKDVNKNELLCMSWQANIRQLRWILQMDSTQSNEILHPYIFSAIFDQDVPKSVVFRHNWTWWMVLVGVYFWVSGSEPTESHQM